MDDLCADIFEKDGTISELKESLVICKERALCMESTIRLLLKRQHRGVIGAFDHLTTDLFGILHEGISRMSLSSIKDLILKHTKPKLVVINLMLTLLSCDRISFMFLDSRTVIFSRFDTLVASTTDALGGDIYDIIQQSVNRLHKDFKKDETIGNELTELFVDVLNSLKNRMEVIESVCKAMKIYISQIT
jgi:hypothetical protein